MATNISKMRFGDEVYIALRDIDVIQQTQESHLGGNSEMKECYFGPCRVIKENNQHFVIQAPSGNIYQVNSALISKCNDVHKNVTQDEEMFKKLHTQIETWNEYMKQLTNQEVEIIQKEQDSNYKTKWNNEDSKCFKECKDNKQLKEGDKVKIISDINKWKTLQEDHGGWSDIMSILAGEEVKIIKILSSDNYLISGLGVVWLINSKAIDNTTKNTSSKDTEIFNNGDNVKISSDIEKSKALQVCNGGWVSEMKECAGKIGIVHYTLATGVVIVKCNNRIFAYNPKLLAKIREPVKEPKFCRGDIVRVINDKGKVKKLQEGHGEWIEDMEILLGEKGKVKSIDPDGDLVVKILRNTVTFNSKCVEKIESDTDSESDSVDLTDLFINSPEIFEGFDVLKEILDNAKNKFYKAIYFGDLDKVLELVDSVGVNTSNDTIYPLMLAVSEGYEEIAKLLLEKNADINAKDRLGNTALHFSIMRHRLNICALLIDKGADINMYNNKKFTPITLASVYGSNDILKLLVSKLNANLNVKDSDGNTPLHLATHFERIESLKILLDAGADIKYSNKIKLSPFHLAASEGHVKILEMIVKNVGPEIVNFQNDDKFTALHLAVLNDHEDCLKVLIDEKADINIKCKNGLTALHFAVFQKYFDCVKILVNKKAELNVKDKDGNTPLHFAMIKCLIENSMIKGLENIFWSENLMKNIQKESKINVEDIAMYLVTKGAKLHIKNNHGITPMDVCENDELKIKLFTLENDFRKKEKILKHPVLKETKPGNEKLNAEILNIDDKTTEQMKNVYGL